MKTFFSLTLAALLALTGLIVLLRPREAADGRRPLVWVSDDNPARREQIALFNRLNPDLRLRLDPGNVDMSKVIVQSLAGVGPDLFDIYDGFALSAYVKADIAWDITEGLAKAGVDVARDVWPAAHTMCLIDGRAFGFPRNATADALFYNRTLLKQQGLAAPPAFVAGPEFLRLAKALTRRDAQGRATQYGFMFLWVQYPAFLRQWNATIYTPGGTRCVLDQPRAVAAIQYMHDLIYRHRVSPTPEQENAMATSGGWGSGPITLFGGGRIAMALGGRWWLCTLRNTANFPGLDAGMAEVQFGPERIHRGYGGVTAINRHSPRRQNALRFLLYMASAPYNRLINHQADGQGPMRKYSQEPGFLRDPAYPRETQNAVWRDILTRSVPDEVSPFVNGATAARIIANQLDLVRNNLKTPAQALSDAAREVNLEIQKTLERDPSLAGPYARAAVRDGAWRPAP